MRYPNSEWNIDVSCLIVRTEIPRSGPGRFRREFGPWGSKKDQVWSALPSWSGLEQTVVHPFAHRHSAWCRDKGEKQSDGVHPSAILRGHSSGDTTGGQFDFWLPRCPRLIDCEIATRRAHLCSPNVGLGNSLPNHLLSSSICQTTIEPWCRDLHDAHGWLNDPHRIIRIFDAVNLTIDRLNLTMTNHFRTEDFSPLLWMANTSVYQAPIMLVSGSDLMNMRFAMPWQTLVIDSLDRYAFICHATTPKNPRIIVMISTRTSPLLFPVRHCVELADLRHVSVDLQPRVWLRGVLHTISKMWGRLIGVLSWWRNNICLSSKFIIILLKLGWANPFLHQSLLSSFDSKFAIS